MGELVDGSLIGRGELVDLEHGLGPHGLAAELLHCNNAIVGH
jgi:hypothetical protein